LSKHGYYLLHWSDAGMTYWAISDVDPADLKTFAEAYASAK
jgi:anti-sigma factor RsiW